MKYKEEFDRFLKDNKIYGRFYIYRGRPLEYICERVISKSFVWVNTDENSDFWEDISNEWKKVYSKLISEEENQKSIKSKKSKKSKKSIYMQKMSLLYDETFGKELEV